MLFIRRSLKTAASALLIAVTLLSLASQAMAREKQSVSICAPDADVYPFFIYKGAESGTNPDIIRAAFNRPNLQHVQLDIVKRPWKRCNLELQSGAIDMVVGGYDAQRDDAGVYPNELGFKLNEMVFSTADVCFISAKGPQMQRTLRGIAGEIQFNVGVLAGFSQEHKPGIKPQWLVIYNHIEKYQLLQKGRVDAIVQVCSMDGYPIATRAETTGYTEFETLYPPYLSNPAYIVFSPAFAQAHSELARQILLAVNEVDKEAIYKRYRNQ